MQEKIDALVNKLAEKRWCVAEDFFSPTLCQELRDELLEHHNAQTLRAAQIGKNQQQQLLSDFRGDHILWLDGASAAQQAFLNLMEKYRQQLNQELYLGLQELEAHFALYPAGTRYQKHLDSFQNNNLRRVTIVAYLNPHWCSEDQGELIIYDKNDDVIASVAPRTGTLVSFVSEDFPHEVSTTQAQRASIAGWFRVRP